MSNESWDSRLPLAVTALFIIHQIQLYDKEELIILPKTRAGSGRGPAERFRRETVRKLPAVFPASGGEHSM